MAVVYRVWRRRSQTLHPGLAGETIDSGGRRSCAETAQLTYPFTSGRTGCSTSSSTPCKRTSSTWTRAFWHRRRGGPATQGIDRGSDELEAGQARDADAIRGSKRTAVLGGSEARCSSPTARQLQEAQVARALRTLDISTTEKEQRTFVADDLEPDDESVASSAAMAEILAELEGLDLDEAEAAEVFAALDRDRQQQKNSWSANKFFKQALRKDGKDRSGGLATRAAASSSASGTGSSTTNSGPPQRRKRLSIAELKLVSKCANCSKKGNWHAECKEPKY
eukprot:6460902-Amphidinium_carterae.1